jgi:hypothetical protein
MASISAPGIGSGLDINSIVSQLVAAEGQPVRNRLDRTETELQTRISAYGAAGRGIRFPVRPGQACQRQRFPGEQRQLLQPGRAGGHGQPHGRGRQL